MAEINSLIFNDLEVENGKNATMHDALETVKEYGFDVLFVK